MPGRLTTGIADVWRSGKPTKKPKLSNDGSIFNTPLQFNLKLKKGARVILTYNVNVIDSLTNGALGTVVGFEKTASGSISSIHVLFDDDKVGKDRRKKNPTHFQRTYHDTPVTPISRIEFRFNLSKNPTSQNDIMTATQFPLKLAFACTAHKMQGTTIPKPNALVIDLKSVKEAAQAYVMMSRVQCLKQLFILNELPSSKIYPSAVANSELERLNKVACNEEEMTKRSRTLVFSLNVRSLVKHHEDILLDYLAKAEILAIQETWCDSFQGNTHLAIPGYHMHFESKGRGKGVATYFKDEFKVTATVNAKTHQMIKVSRNGFHVINVYCSKGANNQLLLDLDALTKDPETYIVVGDFNENFLCNPKPTFVRQMNAKGFIQIVDLPTHIQGGCLDHVYVKQSQWKLATEVNFRTYTDHAAITVMVEPGSE